MKRLFLLPLLIVTATAQQEFDLPAPQLKTTPTPTAPVAAPVATSQQQQATPAVTATTTPNQKKKNKATTTDAKTYSGKVKITFCDKSRAIGTDLKTGQQIICVPRFKGAHPGMVAAFSGYKVLAVKDGAIFVRCRAGMEDLTPYVSPTSAAVGAAGTAMGVAGAILRALHRWD